MDVPKKQLVAEALIDLHRRLNVLPSRVHADEVFACPAGLQARRPVLEELLFATKKETILLAIEVKFCQMFSGAGLRTDTYLRTLPTARLPRTPPSMRANFRIGLPSHVKE
jgi:hypothetical protein